MFMSGFFVALLYSVTHNSLPPGAIIPTLPFLLLDIWLAIPIYMVTNTRTEIRTRISFWTLVVFAARWMAFNGFSTWFWFKGINTPNSGQCKEPRAFFFANIGAYTRWFSIFGKIGYICGIFISAFLVYKLVVKFLERISMGDDIEFDERWAWSQQHNVEEGQNPWEGELNGWFGLIVSMSSALSGLALGIVGIELMIRWNDLAGLSGISSTGQLIPFIVGVFSMFRGLVLLFV